MKSLSDTCRDKAPTVSSSPFFYTQPMPISRGVVPRRFLDAAQLSGQSLIVADVQKPARKWKS